MIEFLTDIFQSIVAERWSFLVMRLRSSREPSEEDEGSCPSTHMAVPLLSAATPAAPAPSNPSKENGKEVLNPYVPGVKELVAEQRGRKRKANQQFLLGEFIFSVKLSVI